MAINIFGISDEGKTDMAIAKEGIAAFRRFLSDIGAPKTLGYYKIDDTDIDTLVEKSMGGAEKIGFMSGLDKKAVRAVLLASM